MIRLYKNSSEATILDESLAQLGLESEKGKLLYFVRDKNSYAHEPSIWFQLEQAGLYHADAVFFKESIRENEYIPQIYIYDQTNLELAVPSDLTDIHKKVWTGGAVPLVCVFSKTEIKILDTTKPVEEPKKNVFEPVYLVENLKNIAKGHRIFNEHFAQKLKSGAYWDNSNVDFYKNSSYSQLTALLRKVIDKFTEESGLKNNKEIVQRLIIQCILVKYLEERRDEDNNRVFPPSFFQKYGESQQFSDVLRKGFVFDFFADLNTNHFNGGIFKWDNSKELFEGKQRAFDYLAEVLRGHITVSGQQLIEFEDNFSRLYVFNYIPVELISRLYEEFIIKENKKRKQESEALDSSQKKNDGIAYTPSHLVKLLINEAIPLTKIPENLDDFKALDPACGSAIFLVVAFKRLVQWWRQKNRYKKPELKDLKQLLNAVYGVDSDPKAVQISIFSLCIALCDELSPKEIWDNLTFHNLEGRTIFCKDFFDWKEEWLKKEDSFKFNVVIGNPPFIRGGIDRDLNTWKINEDIVVEIPQNQIALRFLSDSFSLLKDKGLSCLIVKSLPLLYSSSVHSINYLRALTQQFHIEQVFDFTPLARNGVLWDGVDVDSAAIFVTNAKPDHDRNILHAIFRRTRANEERIYFEIDKYDLHFVLHDEVYENPYIFKINLLGGGRLKNLYYRMSDITTVDNYLSQNNCQANEGFMFGKGGKLSEEFMYDYPTLPTRAFSETGIDFEQLHYIDKKQQFISIKNRLTYESPNIVIKENIGKNKMLIHLNTSRNFTFKDKIIGVYSLEKNIEPIEKLYQSFSTFQDLYRLVIFLTSSQLLVGKNTAILKEDIMRLPILEESFKLSSVETNIIEDVLKLTQYFIRRPETAEVLKPLKGIKEEISFYGNEFSNALNKLYADDVNTFKLTDIIQFEKENMIGALFSYNERKNMTPQFRTEKEVTQIDGLINFDINDSLTATRIIQYYAPNKVLFVKPNQKRYWLASIAYRDADNVFADILNNQ
jgi:hypothetical protein